MPELKMILWHGRGFYRAFVIVNLMQVSIPAMILMLLHETDYIHSDIFFLADT